MASQRAAAMWMILMTTVGGTGCSSWRSREISSTAVANVVSRFRHTVMDRCSGETATVQSMCRRSHAAAGTIEVAAENSEIGASPAYYYSLKANVRTVNGALSSTASDRIYLLEQGTRGLEVKADRARLGGAWTQNVKLVVNTHATDDQPVQGLQVFFRPRTWGRWRQPWRPFSTRSTPAVQWLPPDVYDIATKGEAPVQVELGTDGEAQKTITIKVH